MAKAKKIKNRPSLAVSGLGAPTRGDGNRWMSTSWGIPSNLTSTKKTDRATGLTTTWAINTSTGTYRAVYNYGIGQTSSSINLDGVSLGSWFNRNSFYPRSNRRLYSVSVTVTTKNNKGNGKSVSQTRSFGAPRTPSVAALSFNTENGVISTTIDTDAGNDYYERLDTKYAITVTSPFLNDGKPTNTSDSASTSTSFSINYDARDYMRLDYNQYIKVVVSAYARGYAGNSGTASRTEYISYPAQATIEGVDVSGRDATSKCTIRINPNSTTEHPVDKVKLQVAADVTYDDANDIPANDWEDTDITDNANCTALSIATSELLPSRGNHTFVRVVTYHLHEGVLYRYSEPRRVEELETPTAPSASINIEILEAHTGADGKSAVVRLGWNKDGQDDYTGTELSWSDSEDTWKSTNEPNHHEFTWSDGELTYEGVTYHDSAEITIKGLSEGEKYFIKARRYLEADNEEYSAYSNTATIFTSEIPESIVASCSRYIADGDPLSVYWTFAGNGIQTEWQILRVVNGALDGTVIAYGKGSAGATQISAERIAELATDNTLTFVVQASTGSGFVSSEEHSVSIIEKPTLEITGSSLVHVHEEDEQTYTDDIVQIDNSRGVLNTKSLKVSLEPIQDLNGYDKPWSGGNGKNKIPFPYTDDRTEIVGVSVTTHDDGTITFNGTPSGGTMFFNLTTTSANPITLEAGTYTLSNGGITGNLCRITAVKDGSYFTTTDSSSGNTTFTLEEQSVFSFYISTPNGTAMNNITVKPMLEEGSTATAYEPYSNICPIYGRTEVETVVSPTTSAEEGNTYTTALGRTVYGGTLDVVSGELTVEWVKQVFTSFSGNKEVDGFRTQQALSGITGAYGELVCNMFTRAENYRQATSYDYPNRIGYNGSGVILLNARSATTIEELNALIPQEGCEIVYPLATPQTYQLTPQEVELLTGTNNVWNDASDTELTTAEVLVDGDFLRTNDLSITCESNQLCDLITIVTSQGASGQFPQGVLMQAAGDTVHSDIYRPIWTNGSASINLPTGLNFWDGGKYTASIVGVDRATGLRSPEVTLDIPVDWTNQAVSPVQVSYTLTTDTSVDTDEAYYEKVGNAYVLVTPEGNENPQEEGWYTQDETSFVTLTVIDEKDSDGDHRQAVQIALTPPTGSSETDVYDIYRMDIENPSLIGEGFPLTYTAIDEHAPFGKDVDLRYRIAIRTVDGDVEFSDIEYTADCENIRFDWAGGSLELPYGNSIGDSFRKDADIRRHMNGVSNGYWNRGVERKSSLSSSIIKIVQPRDIERARQLARYAGAVFVRLPNGSAFEADVQVTDLSIKNEAVTAVAFDATEIGLTSEFMLPTPFRLEDE